MLYFKTPTLFSSRLSIPFYSRLSILFYTRLSMPFYTRLSIPFYILFSILLFISSAAMPTIFPPLEAQEVYSKLHDSEHLLTFTEVSESLVCQCGCNFVLSSCPHVECPWGVPTRRFIEELIRAGMSTEEILVRFEIGFDRDLLDKSPTIVRMLQEGRGELVSRLGEGYGPAISAKASPWGYLLILIPFFLLAALLLRHWFSSNRSSFFIKRQFSLLTIKRGNKKRELEKVGLEEAGLEKAELKKAGLEEAGLKKVELKKAGLEKAKLKEAELEKAELEKREQEFSPGSALERLGDLD